MSVSFISVAGSCSPLHPDRKICPSQPVYSKTPMHTGALQEPAIFRNSLRRDTNCLQVIGLCEIATYGQQAFVGLLHLREFVKLCTMKAKVTQKLLIRRGVLTLIPVPSKRRS